ncbi:DUF1761 domain-containing protein [Microvirga brassicacearum]|uniref:DUF1761 domain-containing protein n=1 Tax=Microvirga brassicacearum TaxID=2580413 RepID=A0A5N3P9L4_9HYPH|nr:DUF1761 domain-containing protein [Microvirga brassicacearum]KAB0266430.1 DUF1761 domain-containing protein [Microvirga brassicacearum]
MSLTGISALSVFLAAIAAWLVGAVWYMGLAKPWMAAIGKTREELVGPSGKPSIVPFVTSFLAELVMAVVLAGFIVQIGTVDVAHGMAVAFMAWLGFVATSMVVNHGFGGARPMLTVIDSGHWLAVLLVEGAVIGWFGR